MDSAAITTTFDSAAADIAKTLERLQEAAATNYDEALRARRMEDKYQKLYSIARKELVGANLKLQAANSTIAELEDALAAAELQCAVAQPAPAAKRARHEGVIADVTFDYVTVEDGRLKYGVADAYHPKTALTLRVVERSRYRDGCANGSYSVYYVTSPTETVSYRSKAAVIRALSGPVPNCTV